MIDGRKETKRNERSTVLKRIQEIQINLECVLIELQQLHTYSNTIFNIDLNKTNYNTHTHTLTYIHTLHKQIHLGLLLYYKNNNTELII